jgi:hypothetical protein
VGPSSESGARGLLNLPLHGRKVCGGVVDPSPQGRSRARETAAGNVRGGVADPSPHARKVRGGVILLAFLLSLFAAGQEPTGGVRGLIMDKEFNVPISGVQVWVVETNAKAESGDTGHYAIYKLPPGSYTLVFRKPGFESITNTNTVVTAGSMNDLPIILPGEFVMMAEMVVRPLNLNSGSDEDLLNLRSQSSSIVNLIGSETMSIAGAGDAAEGLKLVSGASVRGGKYAVVRGLSDRFLNTRMNGIALPTADPDVRAVQLDLFPSSLIQSIQVYKTFTPDLPGDTSGGSVDIITKTIPDEFTVKFSTGVKYNSQSNGNSNFLTSGQDMDYLGLDEGDREQLFQSGEIATVPTSRRRPGQWTAAEQEAARKLDAQTRAFSKVIGPTREKSDPVSYSWGLTYGDRLTLSDQTVIGWLNTWSYKRSVSYYEDGVDQFKVGTSDMQGYKIPIDSGEDSDAPEPDQWKKEKGEQTIRWGLGSTFGIEHAGHSASLSYIRTQHTEEEAIRLYDDVTNERRYWQDESLIYTARALESIQLRGEHPLGYDPPPLSLDFGIGDLKKSITLDFDEPVFNWAYSTNAASQDQPDRRFFFSEFFFNSDGVDDPPNDSSLNDVWTSPRGVTEFAQRSWREIAESNDYTQLDLTLPYHFNEREGKLKFGFSENDTLRTYEQDTFFYEAPNVGGAQTDLTVSHEDGEVADWDIPYSSFFLDPERLGYPPPNGEGQEIPFADLLRVENGTNWVIQDFPNDVDYEGTMTIKGTYGMAEIPVVNWLKLIGGARVEETFIKTDVDDASSDPNSSVAVISVRGTDSISLVTANTDEELDAIANAEISQTDVLPSMGFILGPWKDVKLRGTWSQTIARPTFKEITPVAQQETLSSQVFAGNPDLKIAQIENYDLRAEWINEQGDLVSLSGFFKDITDAIDYEQRPGNGSAPIVLPFNFKKGEVLGAEFEVRKNLEQLRPWLKGVTLGGNYTWLEASVEVPEDSVTRLRNHLKFTAGRADADSADLDTRRMKDQPDYILNLFLLIESDDEDDEKTTLGIFFNQQGETLLAGESLARGEYIPNLVQLPAPSLDVSLSKNFKSGWKITIRAENLLDPEHENVWQSEHIPTVATAESYKKGVTYSVSVSKKW